MLRDDVKINSRLDKKGSGKMTGLSTAFKIIEIQQYQPKKTLT